MLFAMVQVLLSEHCGTHNSAAQSPLKAAGNSPFSTALLKWLRDESPIVASTMAAAARAAILRGTHLSMRIQTENGKLSMIFEVF
jgi:hypothetical protein